MKPTTLPWETIHSRNIYGTLVFDILQKTEPSGDDAEVIAVNVYSLDNAEYIVTAANAHYPMLKALELALRILDKGYWKTAVTSKEIGNAAGEVAAAIAQAKP